MRLLWLLLVPLLAGLACGSQAGTATPEPQPMATLEPTAAPAAEPAATPDEPDTPAPSVGPPEKIAADATLLRLGPEPTTLDPHLAADAESAIYIHEIFGGLVTIDRDLQLAGDLAEGWTIGDGGKTYTFNLRRDAKFHDGKPVTARDVKWSFERVADPATQSVLSGSFLGDIVGFNDKLGGRAGSVAGVQVLDDHTISITLDAPRAYFLAKLTHLSSFVLDRNNVEGNPDWLENPNGTGPFKLAEYEFGDRLRLTRNDLYHLERAKLGEVSFLLSGGDALLMYENDEIHVTGLSAPGAEIALDPSNPLREEVIEAPPTFTVTYFGMNVDRPPFDDVKVRQALNYAVDKDRLAATLLDDLVSPGGGILPPGFPAYTPEIEGYSFDPEKAVRLLQESKYGQDLDNFPGITLSLPGSFGAPVSPVMQAIVQTWQETLGIEMDILQTAWPIFLEDIRNSRFQMLGGLAWTADYIDPENFLDVLFHSESGNNYGRYSNAEVDRQLEQARGELDEAERFRTYHRVEQQILDDAPWVPLWHETGGYVLLKPNVKGYELFPISIPRFRYVYITEE